MVVLFNTVPVLAQAVFMLFQTCLITFIYKIIQNHKLSTNIDSVCTALPLNTPTFPVRDSIELRTVASLTEITKDSDFVQKSVTEKTHSVRTSVNSIWRSSKIHKAFSIFLLQGIFA